MAKLQRAPEAIAEKQIRRLQESTPDIESGINAVVDNPCEKAAEHLDDALAGYRKAIDSGKMKRNLLAVSLGDWKRKALAKVGRIGEGAEGARPVIVQFHKQRNAVQATIDATLEGLPRRTLADSERRMLTQMRAMAAFGFDKSIK